VGAVYQNSPHHVEPYSLLEGTTSFRELGAIRLYSVCEAIAFDNLHFIGNEGPSVGGNNSFGNDATFFGELGSLRLYSLCNGIPSLRELCSFRLHSFCDRAPSFRSEIYFFRNGAASFAEFVFDS